MQLLRIVIECIIAFIGDVMSKILIAEDERDIRELVGFTLQLSGHTLVFATNGEEAIRLAASEFPDLIIMDFRMPVMNGG